jgi:hypothetical protein
MLGNDTRADRPSLRKISRSAKPTNQSKNLSFLINRSVLTMPKVCRFVIILTLKTLPTAK